MLPISVIIPTRNSAAEIESHVAALQEWIGSAQEAIVVDGESSDGTLEILRSKLRHPNRKIFSRPPGLYEAWNYAVAQSSAEYVYIATVSDTINEPGIRHLFDVAKEFDTDLVLSAPRFKSKDGEEDASKKWTIHHYLEARGIRTPALLPRTHLFLTSVFAGPAGMLGSSASNLYRTTVLKARPFPLEYGHVCDSAWGIANGLSVRAAVTPEKCATFLLHPNAGQVSSEEEGRLGEGLLSLAERTLRDLDEGVAVQLRGEGGTPQLGKLKEFVGACGKLQRSIRKENDAYLELRRNVGWFLKPAAWCCRARRNRDREALGKLWLNSLIRFTF